MFNFDRSSIVALDFSGEVITSVSIRLNTKSLVPSVDIIKINEYKNSEELLAELPKLKYSILVIIPSNDETFTFATTPLTNLNWHDEVRRKGLDPKTHSINYIQLSKSSLLCAVSNSTVEQLKSIRNATIVPDVLALTHCYYRNYAEYHNDVTAIIHFSSTHAQLVVFNQTALIWSGSVDFEKGKSLEQYQKDIFCLLQASQQDTSKSFNISAYDHLIVSGNFTDNTIANLKAFAFSTEIIDPFRTNLYSIQNLSKEERESKESHQLPILLCAATMLLEGVNVNLNDHNEQLNLINELGLEPNLHARQNALVKLSNNLNNKFAQLANNSVPMLANQKRLVIVGVVLCLMLTGYRVYAYHSELSSIDAEITSEQNKFKQLETIKTSHDEYQSRLAAIQARIKFINDTQTKQLRVFTTVNQLNTRLPKLVNFSDLRVTGTAVEGSGWSTDEALVREFMSDINSSTVFAEVTPTFQNPEPKKVTFTFATNYVGSVEAAPLPSTLRKLETTTNTQTAQQKTETKTETKTNN